MSRLSKVIVRQTDIRDQYYISGRFAGGQQYIGYFEQLSRFSFRWLSTAEL